MTQPKQLYNAHIGLTCYPTKKNPAGRHPVTSGHPARLLALEFGAKHGLNVREVVEVKKSRIVINCVGFLQDGINLGKNLVEAANTLREAAAWGYLGAYESAYVVGDDSITGYELIKRLSKAGQVEVTAIIAQPGVQAQRTFNVRAR